MNENGKIV